MTLYEGRGFTIHRAVEADNAGICALFRELHLKGDLDVNQERDPDFFALQRLHHGTPLPMVARDAQGAIQACGSIILRPGWLDGQRITTGYLCDLRVRPGFRAGVGLVGAFRTVLEGVARDHGAELFNTVIFDDNVRARTLLTGDHGRKRRQPAYRPMTPFRMTSVQFVRPHRGPRREVLRATPADKAELVAFLTERGQKRLLGEDFSAGLLDRRLADWPGFGLSDFYLARRGGRIVGCLAPWDSAPVKRTRVLGYHGPMAWVKRAFDLSALVLRHPRLPEPGGCFRFAFLTHLEVEGDDPLVLEDLLRAVHRDQRGQGRHFVSALVPVGSPLEAAFRPFHVQHTAMTLYAVHLPESRYAERGFETAMPGFEMALS